MTSFVLLEAEGLALSGCALCNERPELGGRGSSMAERARHALGSGTRWLGTLAWQMKRA